MKISTSIKIDKDVKNKAKKLADDFGLSLSAVINAQLKQFVRDQQLVISKSPIMSASLEDLLGPIEKDMKANKNISKAVKSNKDLDAYFAAL